MNQLCGYVVGCAVQNFFVKNLSPFRPVVFTQVFTNFFSLFSIFQGVNFSFPQFQQGLLLKHFNLSFNTINKDGIYAIHSIN